MTLGTRISTEGTARLVCGLLLCVINLKRNLFLRPPLLGANSVTLEKAPMSAAAGGSGDEAERRGFLGPETVCVALKGGDTSLSLCPKPQKAQCH